MIIFPFQSHISTSSDEKETVEIETQMDNQIVSEQTESEEASNSHIVESEKGEAQASSAEPSQAEARQPESEVSEIEIPNVGKILVLADADGYNEEVEINYKTDISEKS